MSFDTYCFICGCSFWTKKNVNEKDTWLKEIYFLNELNEKIVVGDYYGCCFSAEGDNKKYCNNSYDIHKDKDKKHKGYSCHQDCWNLIKKHYGIELTYDCLDGRLMHMNIYKWEYIKYGTCANRQYDYNENEYTKSNSYMWKNPLKNKKNRNRILELDFPFLDKKYLPGKKCDEFLKNYDGDEKDEWKYYVIKCIKNDKCKNEDLCNESCRHGIQYNEIEKLKEWYRRFKYKQALYTNVKSKDIDLNFNMNKSGSNWFCRNLSVNIEKPECKIGDNFFDKEIKSMIDNSYIVLSILNE